jgi:hypothetical protein
MAFCYRDKTFCEALCATLSCPRKFTEIDRAKAEAWWADMPGEPPVAFSDFSAICPDFRPTPDQLPGNDG